MDDFFRNKLIKSFEINEIITVHYFKYAKNFVMDGETHNFYEFVYVDSGSVEIINGEECLQLLQGQAFIHRPNIFHSIKANEKLSNIFVLTFDGKNLEKLNIYDKILTAEKIAKTAISEIVLVASRAFIEPLNIVELKKMTLNDYSDFTALQQLQILIEQLILTFCFRKRQNETQINSRSSLYYDILSYLEKNLDKVLSLEQISAKMGYSVSYIKKVFNQNNKKGILQYHLILKIEKAKHLISENIYSFVEISESLGFSSPQYFSTAFRKHTNMSPKEYMNSVNLTHLL